MSVAGPASEELLNAFRAHYRRYENAVHEAVANSADAVVLWRLGDDLNEYIGLVNEVGPWSRNFKFAGTRFDSTPRFSILRNGS